MQANRASYNSAFFALNIVWGILTIFFLISATVYIKNNQLHKTHQYLVQQADRISDRLDSFVSNLAQVVYTLPMDSLRYTTCEQEILPKMQEVVFNNPKISGLILRDENNDVLCSTFLQSKNMPFYHHSKQLNLLGPINIPIYNKPAFVLEQRIGKYYIDIYLLEQVLKELIQVSSGELSQIILYDKLKHTRLMEIHKKNHQWQIYSPVSNKINLSNLPTHLTASDGLNVLNHEEVIVIADEKKIHTTILTYQLLALLGTLLFSMLLYLIFRHQIGRLFSLHYALVVALKNRLFFPVYQPIFDAQKNEYIGAEVLLRWKTIHGETITPDFFIDDAEQSGLIIPMMLQLIEKTFEECQALLHTNKTFHLAFNLSAIHFTDKQFLSHFFHLTTQYNIPASQIILEITERELLDQKDHVLISQMQDLRRANYALAVDDFGTGHASISYLQHFPFNYLKIDQIFIRAIGTGAITETLSKSIIHMAKHLNLTIIAEGIESDIQYEFLKQESVHLMQGWYFAKAMPIDEFLNFLSRGS